MRRILKMIKGATPEGEILAAIAEKGSKGSLSLDEAERLRSLGISRTLLAAIVTPQVSLHRKKA